MGDCRRYRSLWFFGEHSVHPAGTTALRFRSSPLVLLGTEKWGRQTKVNDWCAFIKWVHKAASLRMKHFSVQCEGRSWVQTEMPSNIQDKGVTEVEVGLPPKSTWRIKASKGRLPHVMLWGVKYKLTPYYHHGDFHSLLHINAFVWAESWKGSRSAGHEM